MGPLTTFAFRMHYLTSNLAHVDGIVISTAASAFILMPWVFPSLQKQSKSPTLSEFCLKKKQKAGLFHTGNGLEDTDDDPLHTCIHG